MNDKLDERDMKILSAISNQESWSTETIHDATGIPKSTVHYRIDKLKESGVITNDLFELDLKQIGLDMTVISEVWAEYDEGYHERVGEKLGQIEGVNQVYFTMGETDFVVISHLHSREKVEELIKGYEGIDEIRRTSSKYVISNIKDGTSIGMLRDYEIDTLFNAGEVD